LRLDAGEIRAFLVPKLAKYKIPKVIEIAVDLPREDFRQDLQAQALRAVLGEGGPQDLDSPPDHALARNLVGSEAWRLRQGRYGMTDFAGRIAVVTGGGSGMGRELVRQLVAQACNVAMCDVFGSAMGETRLLCEAGGLPQGLSVTTHIADVSDAVQVERFRDEIAEHHNTDKIHLLFNNAGIGGGGSMIAHGRDEWERTFNVCWGGVYHCTRTFLPMLQKAEEGHIVNTSSVNGFWASVGPGFPHTAYSAAKFAVKGFTEALITDLRINAPHIKCSVVMPGHIGTSIPLNSRKIHDRSDAEAMNATQIAQTRTRIAATGRDVSNLSDEDIRKMVAERESRFREEAPTSAAEAATIILDGVKADRWRILVGEDAHRLDQLVRESPERAYDLEFFESFAAEVGWRLRP
jgi:NAD(P)-dependent dehydrogenase (short-subunit alcohol dehydrogenase family)